MHRPGAAPCSDHELLFLNSSNRPNTKVLVMCPILSSIEPSQLVVNPVGLEASVPVRVSARGQGEPVPDAVMPKAAATAAKTQDLPTAALRT